ncbi:hypothetical protein PENSPDRAFT_595685 [Peniophora sp. CONT]|nr:hypothetical protein PENSPDRAFT_595685 [Peniophora sp. CONT]
MSLPESIRYLEENVFFVSCFPGKPSGNEINAVLALIVNVFLKLWEGVFFSRTHDHRRGRLVKAVIVPQVSDSEALRQGAGHGAHNHTSFCLYCALRRLDIENMERDTWPAYDMDALLEVVYAWKNAKTDTKRSALYTLHGQRWTPFFELPYFRFLTDNLHDPMHLFKLGLIAELINNCLAHRAPKQKYPSFVESTCDRPPADELLPVHRGTRGACVNARTSLDASVMTEIWADQALTQMPGFATHAPGNWGTTARGKLSAAQWTVILCVHLVVTLIRLWGDLDVSDRRRQLLDHTMKLVDIILLVFQKSISTADIDAYDELIRDYMVNKKHLFKDVTIKPNDHAAMHYGDILRWYGPSCAHDGSYFERCIRRLHSFSINLKPGKRFYIGESPLTLTNTRNTRSRRARVHVHG